VVEQVGLALALRWLRRSVSRSRCGGWAGRA